MFEVLLLLFLTTGGLAIDCQVNNPQFENVQEMADCFTERYRMIGTDLGAFSGSDWIMRAQSGVRVFGDDTKVGDKDMFIMGSTGKSITSTVAARVVAQGYISWNTTAKEMFQDSGLFTVHISYWHSTLQQFLSHGSGAPGLDGILEKHGDMIDYIFNKTSWEPGYDNRDERIYLSKTVMSEPAVVPQGTYLYSIGGFTVAAAMLELATGKTYEQLMQEEVFDRLGMDGCGFGPTTLSSSLPPEQPWGHLSDPPANHIVPVTPGPYANIASSMVPDGGLHCNLESWQRYLATHMAEDEDFLPKDIWTHIHNPITEGHYGFGWEFDNSNPMIGTVWSHGGTDGHNFAYVVIIPRFNVGLVMMQNNAGVMTGGRQGIGFGKALEWMFANLGGKEMAKELSKVVAKDLKTEAQSTFFRYR